MWINSALNGRSPGPKADRIQQEPRPAADHRDVAAQVMAAILAHREVAPLLSDDYFSVDGTLVKAWASMKSFQPKAGDAPPDDDQGSPPEPDTPAEDHPQTTETAPMPHPSHQSRNAEVDFRGEKRSNATHASTTDPHARLKKNPPAPARFCASWVMR
jgi:hypothetical protein